MKSWSTASNGDLWMQFDWDEENRLTRTQSAEGTASYKYNDSGKRIIKKSDTGEVVYVNDNYNVRNNDVYSKHIFAGNTRVATVMKTASTEDAIYYYHGDHLGSSNVVTNNAGGIHENIEYFPYGETWVQDASTSLGNQSMPYKFTSKEQDEETGLYYFGARYYDAKLSKWISTDPAMEKYLPGAGKGSDGLPGLGGVYNSANLDVYHYANNNPVKLIDPDGNETGIFESLFGFAYSTTLMNRCGVNSSAFTSPIDETVLHAVGNAGMVSDVLTSPKFYGLYARGFVGAYQPVNLGPVKGEGGAYLFADTNNSVGITGRAVLTQGNNKFGPFATQYFIKNGEYTLESNIDFGTNYGNFLIRNMTDYTKWEFGGKLGSWFGVEVRWNPYTMFNNFNNFFNSNDSIFKSYIDYQYGGSSGGGSFYFGGGISY